MAAVTSPPSCQSSAPHFPTGRDQEILRYFLFNRFATADKIGRLFFPSLRSFAHRRRLRLLAERGLIEETPYFLERKRIYRLSKKGLRYLKPQGFPQALFKNARYINQANLHHDELLQDLRLILEASPIVTDFKPEHQIKVELAKLHGKRSERENRHKVPDALFTLHGQPRQFRVALELELAPKSRKRSFSMLRQISTSDDFNIAFLVVKSAALRERFLAHLTQLRGRDPIVMNFRPKKGIYFSVLDEFLNEKLRARFIGEETSFSLEDLASRRE